ncbi:MAG: hypothetical protein QOG80_2771 [Pseudonocardiales bacterium]|jgi:hypothetical protein|nr:hypothetical protein [Pseudonocardiales bacterium]
MLASGIAGVVIPVRVAGALDLPPGGSRGVAEARVGLGGTYAALGAWGLVRGGPAQTAVGVTWLGAAATRLFALRAGRPATDWTFWAYLAAEAGLGLAAIRPRTAR